MKPVRLLYELLEEELELPLADFVIGLRKDERSWPYIARKLQERTGVSVSDEWLRVKFGEQAASVAS